VKRIFLALVGLWLMILAMPLAGEDVSEESDSEEVVDTSKVK